MWWVNRLAALLVLWLACNTLGVALLNFTASFVLSAKSPTRCNTAPVTACSLFLLTSTWTFFRAVMDEY